MKIAFLGHRRIAVGALRALKGSAHALAAVVTHHPETCPGEELWLGEAAEVAREAGCPLLQPVRLAGSRAAQELAALGADLWVIVGYLEILTPELLSLPPRGAINFHAALLPRYRGRAPLTRALMNGEPKVGATVHFVNAAMDSGDILVQAERRVGRDDTVVTLYDWASRIAPDLLLRALDAIESDRVERRPQLEEDALAYAELTPRDRLIRWEWPAERIYDQVRALVAPWPGALTHYRGEELLVWGARAPDPAERSRGADAGRVLALDPERGALVECGQGVIWITRVQGGATLGVQPADAFFRRPGVRLGLDLESRLLRLERQVAVLEQDLHHRTGRTSG